MREKFLEHLDAASGRWDVRVFEAKHGEIWTGVLLQENIAKYPIIRGIPRLLRGYLLRRCLNENPEFEQRHARSLSFDRMTPDVESDPNLSLKLETIESFGYEWTSFGKMLGAYEQNHKMYFDPCGPEFFKGKLVLDAGCGTGRHVYYAAKYGAEVVAIDLSAAIDVAFQNTREFGASVHVAQADFYDLPFPANHFDLVESVGVIHHLPDPQAGFDELVKLLRPGGTLYVYLYSNAAIKPKNGMQAVKIFFKERILRPYSRRLPFPLLKTWCFIMAAVGRVCFNYPYYLARRIPATRDLAAKLSLAMYADYPFYVLHTDLFDWIATPVNRYYERWEVERFFANRGFESVDVFDDPGWRAFGKKAIVP